MINYQSWRCPNQFSKKLMWRNCGQTLFRCVDVSTNLLIFWLLPVNHPFWGSPIYGTPQMSLFHRHAEFAPAILRKESVAATVLTQHEDTKPKTPVRGNRAQAIILKTRSGKWEDDGHHLVNIQETMMTGGSPISGNLQML